MSPRASIVMVAWGKRAMTEMTLGSLERALGPKLGTEFELVLVDNASPDDTLELFDRWEDRATVVRLPENRQFSGGCNAGAAAATADVLLFLNNDMEFLPGTLEQLVDQALEPGVGIVGARLLYPDGGIQHGGVIWRDFKGVGPTPVHLFHFGPGDLPHARAVYDLDGVTGACIVMRTALFREIGGFDEEFVNGLEDIDLCVRVRVRGLRVVYRGDIVLVHHESVTRGRDLSVSRANIQRFHAKWAGAFDDDAEVVEGLFGGVLAGADGLTAFAEYVEGQPIAVEGYVSGLGSDSGESRAFALALESAGVPPAVRDRHPAWVTARLTSQELSVLQRQSERPRSPLGLTLHVTAGPWAPVPGGRGTIARLAAVPRRREPLAASHVWAATPWLVDELVERGLAADRVAYVPPVILGGDVGPGGGGILVLLGVGDHETSLRVLDAVAGAGVPVRAVPLVATPVLEQLVAERAPHVELLAPVSGEHEVAALAATSDVVVGADPDDRYDRRVLTATAAGAAPVLLRRGPGSAVLGDDVVAGIDGLADAVQTALGAGDRQARADRVASVCSPAVLAPLLRELVDAAAPRLEPDELQALGGG